MSITPSQYTFEQIASDIGIFRYKNEEDISFHTRVAYSASRFWVHAFCLDDENDGEKGIGKQALNYRLKKWLSNLANINPSLKDYFQFDNSGISIIYNRMLNVNDILEWGFDGKVCARRETRGYLPTGQMALFGFYDPTSNPLKNKLIISGLMTIIHNSSASALPYNQWWTSYLDYLPWEPLNNYSKVVYIDPNCSRWNINYNDAHRVDPIWINGIAIAIVENAVRGNTYLLARHTRKGVTVSRITWLLAEEVFFWMRSKVTNPVVASYQKLDAKHSELYCPLGFLPASHNRYIDALSWPLENITSQQRRIVRNEALPTVKSLLGDCSVLLKEKINGQKLWY